MHNVHHLPLCQHFVLFGSLSSTCVTFDTANAVPQTAFKKTSFGYDEFVTNAHCHDQGIIEEANRFVTLHQNFFDLFPIPKLMVPLTRNWCRAKRRRPETHDDRRRSSNEKTQDLFLQSLKNICLSHLVCQFCQSRATNLSDNVDNVQSSGEKNCHKCTLS